MNWRENKSGKKELVHKDASGVMPLLSFKKKRNRHKILHIARAHHDYSG